MLSFQRSFDLYTSTAVVEHKKNKSTLPEAVLQLPIGPQGFSNLPRIIEQLSEPLGGALTFPMLHTTVARNACSLPRVAPSGILSAKSILEEADWLDNG